MIRAEKKLKWKGHDIFILSDLDNSQILYAPTLKKLFRIDQDLASTIIENGIEPTYFTNEGHRLLAKKLRISLTDPLSPIPIHKKKTSYFNLAFGLTKQCNLACIYCHSDAGNSRNSLNKEIIDKAIDFAFNTCLEKELIGVMTSFASSGEPTMKWDLFKYSVERLKERGGQTNKKVKIYLTTNGFYNDIIRKYLCEHMDDILLSFDGNEDIQNFHRPNKAKSESFETVLNSAKYFNKHAKAFAVRPTVSKYSVALMPSIVKYFGELGLKGEIIFEPLTRLGRALKNKEDMSPRHEEFVRYFYEAREVGKKLNIIIQTSAITHARRLVTAYCGAIAAPSFIVNPNGTVTCCERDTDGEKFGYGSFNLNSKNFEIDAKRLEQTKEYLKIPSECNDCFCKYHCAGDCPDLRKEGQNRCELNRLFLKKELEIILS